MNKGLILVVEDDVSVAEANVDTLTLAGFQTATVHDGRAALMWLAANTPALVVLDMHLPFVSGHEVLDYLHADARLANTPVIVTTGDARTLLAMKDEADLVLLKPVDPAQLSELAARLLSSHSSD
jgi:CheY-like chemotaxis protein